MDREQNAPCGAPRRHLQNQTGDDGAWVCDAVDHNAPEGCSNPKCFKFKHLLPVIDELTPLRSK
jgi:hypothetical protein